MKTDLNLKHSSFVMEKLQQYTTAGNKQKAEICQKELERIQTAKLHKSQDIFISLLNQGTLLQLGV